MGNQRHCSCLRRNVTLTFALIHDNVFFCSSSSSLVGTGSNATLSPAPERVSMSSFSRRCDGWSNVRVATIPTARCMRRLLMALFVDLLYIPFKWTSELFMKTEITSQVKYSRKGEEKKYVWLQPYNSCLPIHRIAVPCVACQRTRKMREYE